MAKVKSHSAAKKRFKKTASGKIKRASGYRRHHAWAKSPKKVRQLRSGVYVESAMHKKIAALIPYA